MCQNSDSIDDVTRTQSTWSRGSQIYRKFEIIYGSLNSKALMEDIEVSITWSEKSWDTSIYIERDGIWWLAMKVVKKLERSR